MSGYDYRSKSGYADGSHPDYVAARPIISYDAARGTHTYVRRVEARAATAHKNSTSHMTVDPSVEYGRPREVEDFITQILDEVNGLPGLSTSPNPRPSWNRRSYPVKGYPSRDYKSEYYFGGSPENPKILGDHGDPYDHGDRIAGCDYDQPPQRSYGVPNKQYRDQSHLKSDIPRDYQAPKQWDRSPRSVYDHPSHYNSPTKLEIYYVPNNQWGDSSTPRDHEVPNNQWDKSSSHLYDDESPKNQFPEMSKDHGGTNSRWDNSLGKHRSDRWSSYDGHPHSGKPKSPQNYGISNNEWDRSSSPIHEYPPPSGSSGGIPKSRWGNSLMKPQSPKDHQVSNNQWERSSSPIYDHPPATKNIGGVPSNRWGDSVMKPQSPKNHGVPDNQWDLSSSNLGQNHPQPAKNTGGVKVPSSRWGNSLMKPQPPKDHGTPNNQWGRSSSPVHDHPPPTQNTGGIPSSRWGQSPKDHGVPDRQWDRSSSPTNEDPSPPRNTRRVPSDRWDNSLVKPQSPRNTGVPSNRWDRSPNPIHDNLPSVQDTSIVPNTRWGNSFVKPQSPKDHGVPNRQWDRSASPVHPHPVPNGNSEKVLDSPQPNSPAKSQSLKDHGGPNNQLEKPSNFVHERPTQSANIGGVPNSQWSNPPLKLESPNGYNQWDRSSSPAPSNKLGNSLVKPQSAHVANSSYNEPIGNNNSIQTKKPADYSYDHQPKEYGSNNGIKPSNYHASAPSQSTTPPGKVTNNVGDSRQQPKISAGALTEGAKHRSLAPDNPTGLQPKSSFAASEEPRRETKWVR